MTSMTESSLVDLTARMFETAADPRGEGWGEVYETLSKLLSSGPGSLHVYHKREAAFRTLADTNEPGFIDEINRKYFDTLPHKDELLSMKPGDLLRRSQVMSDAEFERSELYQTRWKNFGIFHSITFCLFDDRETSAGVTFTRPISMGGFDDAEIKALAPAMRILQRAVRLHANVLSASEKDRIVLNGLDRISQGVVIVNSTAKVQYANAAAERVLSDRQGIELQRSGTLACEVRADSEKLRALIRGAIDPAAAAAGSSSGAMPVRRRDGSHAMSLRVVPLPMNVTNPFNPKRYAAVLIRPTPTPEDIRAILLEVYGLTATEATIASQLGIGSSLAEVCEKLEITENTGRTHLKRVFAKTDTNRQSSLVRLILSFPPAVE